MLAGNWGVRMRSIRVSTQFSALAGGSVWVDVGCRVLAARSRFDPRKGLLYLSAQD